jgi:hypothetical protein
MNEYQIALEFRGPTFDNLVADRLKLDSMKVEKNHYG